MLKVIEDFSKIQVVIMHNNCVDGFVASRILKANLTELGVDERQIELVDEHSPSAIAAALNSMNINGKNPNIESIIFYVGVLPDAIVLKEMERYSYDVKRFHRSFAVLKANPGILKQVEGDLIRVTDNVYTSSAPDSLSKAIFQTFESTTSVPDLIQAIDDSVSKRKTILSIIGSMLSINALTYDEGMIESAAFNNTKKDQQKNSKNFYEFVLSRFFTGGDVC